MRSNGVNSVLAVFLMITMALTGCVDDLDPAEVDQEELENTVTDESSTDSSSSSYNVTVDSLEAVFNSMNDDGEYYYDREQWVIHDISEIVEIDAHPWFVGVQYHPEYKSTVLEPHPLFSAFVEACNTYANKK